MLHVFFSFYLSGALVIAERVVLLELSNLPFFFFFFFLGGGGWGGVILAGHFLTDHNR